MLWTIYIKREIVSRKKAKKGGQDTGNANKLEASSMIIACKSNKAI